MKYYVPNYYKSFKCIASKCRHSCCIGWEIDIDDASLKRYESIEGALGEKLKACIDLTDEGACFHLVEEERCPFLNQDNLCEIILNEGETALCQICEDHPRFRNEIGSRTEMGLGLCCEEACRIILMQHEPMFLVEEGINRRESFDDEVSVIRNELFHLIQDRSKSIFTRLKEVEDFIGKAEPVKTVNEWIEIYREFERLDDAWGYILDQMTEARNTDKYDQKEEIMLENIACYFLFRYAYIKDELYEGRVLIAVHAVRFLARFMNTINEESGSKNKIGFQEIVRMYSSEIEYSQDNIDTLLDILTYE